MRISITKSSGGRYTACRLSGGSVRFIRSAPAMVDELQELYIGHPAALVFPSVWV